VILPTGDVFLSGGVTSTDDDRTAVLEGEIYSPGIDWHAGAYAGVQAWMSTEPASVVRNYHSVALLTPDGSVWTAGSSRNADQGNPAQVGEMRMEVGSPRAHSELRPSEQMSFSTVKNICPVGRRMCSATHRGRGCSKFQTTAAKEARRPGILAPDNPPPTRFLKKKKELCGTHVPHSFLCEGPPRSQPLRGEIPRNPLWDTPYNPSICPVARFSSRRHIGGYLGLRRRSWGLCGAYGTIFR
jgi:hypothetical protein